jgi:hypothetical protein
LTHSGEGRQCRPHAFHLGGKAESQRHRPYCFNLIEGQCPNPIRRLLRGEQDLANREVGVRESDRGMAWPNLDRCRLLVDVNRHRIVFYLSRYAQIAENFPGKDPGFKGPILLAEEGSARTSHGKRPLRQDVAADGELA